MSIVILLAVVAFIYLMALVALSSPPAVTVHAPMPAPTQTVANDLSELGATVFGDVLHMVAHSSDPTHVHHGSGHHDHDVSSDTDFHVEADDSSSDHGYCADADHHSDASCDSDDGDWFCSDD